MIDEMIGVIMSRKNHVEEPDKNERIKKHDRSHGKNKESNHMKRIKPSHQPAKKQHKNILDVYEKFGEDYDDMLDE